MTFADRFDTVIVNDELPLAQEKVYKTVVNFLNR